LQAIEKVLKKKYGFLSFSQDLGIVTYENTTGEILNYLTIQLDTTLCNHPYYALSIKSNCWHLHRSLRSINLLSSKS